jgi:hypothetical protein
MDDRPVASVDEPAISSYPRVGDEPEYLWLTQCLDAHKATTYAIIASSASVLPFAALPVVGRLMFLEPVAVLAFFLCVISAVRVAEALGQSQIVRALAIGPFALCPLLALPFLLYQQVQIRREFALMNVRSNLFTVNDGDVVSRIRSLQRTF